MLYHSIAEAHTSPATIKAFENCLTHTNIFHILNYMMYEEYIKTADMIDEAGLRRHNIKRAMRECERVYDAYTSYMSDNLVKEKYYLCQDYGRTAYTATEPKLQYLFIAACNLFLKKRMPRARLLAQCVCTAYLLETLHDTWRRFFRTYRDLCGVDFSETFRYANMDEFRRNFKTVYETLFIQSTQDEIRLADDAGCKAAMAALHNHLDDENYLDDAAIKAIRLNPKIYDEYRKEIEQIERNKTRGERDNIADTLAERYKVTRET